MGTHPIFESDFDCLTDTVNMRRLLPLRKFNSVQLRQNSAKTLGYFKHSISPCAFVPQQECYVIERFGKFSRMCEGGIMWKIPLIDSISYVQDNNEIGNWKTYFGRAFFRKGHFEQEHRGGDQRRFAGVGNERSQIRN